MWPATHSRRQKSEQDATTWLSSVAHFANMDPRLRRLLIFHGAGFIKYLDYKTMVTHIIASTLPPKKADEWRRLRVVQPAWVVDSIAAGKLLPWSDYQLIGEGPQQKRIRFNNEGLAVQEGQADQMAGYREQSKASLYTNEIQKRAATIKSIDFTSRDLARVEIQSAPNGDISSSNDSSTTDAAAAERNISPLAEAGGKDEVHESGLGDAEISLLLDEDGIGKEQDAKTSINLLPEPSRQNTMTSEEHNAWLLSDPKIRKASTANPDFLRQFYSESRLHHLSTWRAELKSKMQRLAAEKGATAPAKASKQNPGARRYIMHADFDSFFCAVSLKSAPEYVDKPVAVAHSTGSASEIASCNYPARKFGVTNGMWMKRATELCPDLKVLPYDFPAYEEASCHFYEAVLEVGGVVQSVSVDEALVDVTNIVLAAAQSTGVGVDEGSVWREQEKADSLATKLRQQVLERTGCHVSVGIGGNILLAKVALRRAKPAGQFQVRPEEVLEVLSGLKVEQLPGVAHSIRGKLDEIGVKLVSDLRSVSRERLTGLLGPKTGERLWDYARGIDRTEVGDQPVRKSVSAEVNWGIRFVSQEEAEEFVMNLCKELERRLLNEQVRGRNLTMKILKRAADAPLEPEKHLGHGRCDIFNKTVMFGVATHSAEAIGKEAVSVLRSFRFSPGDLRGLGVQLQKLEPIKPMAAAPDGSQQRLSFSGADKKSVGGSHLSPGPSTLASTQFVLPRDVDPSVLAMLPTDIRRRLVAEPEADKSTGSNDNSNNNNNNNGRSDSGPSKSSNRNQSPMKMWARMQSPARAATANCVADTFDLPADIDMDVLDNLPEDLRAEVLAEYRQHRGQQSNSPASSPQKGRSSSRGGEGGGSRNVGRQGVKRGLWGARGRGGMAAAAAARERRHDAAANRAQSTFLVAGGTESGATHKGSHHGDGNDDTSLLEEPDPAVLAALPEDIRAEVLADYQQRRLEREQEMATLGLLRLEIPIVAARREKWDGGDGSGSGVDKTQTMLQFPVMPAKMSLGGTASSRVLTLAETKSMIQTWHRATCEEGPHEADVEVLERFLTGVVAEERDMDKARKLIVWLEWLVEEEEEDEEEEEEERRVGRQSWQLAVARMKDAVQEAMGSRGLGPMQFG